MLKKAIIVIDSNDGVFWKYDSNSKIRLSDLSYELSVLVKLAKVDHKSLA